VTAVPAGELASGSFVHRPSLIFVASPMPVVVLAELLAHEACHQHFWLVTQVGPVDDGSDRRSRHFSPYVSKQRNLRMMLLTYHAFANAVLFHRECYSRGLVDPIAQERERMFAELFDPYERVLSDSPSLTPLGRQLWQAVAEEVRACTSDPAG
jgi:HEXXH motif-containing protein